MKGLRQGVWRTENLSTGVTNLTNINFANISNQIKFIDTLKYYQQSLYCTDLYNYRGRKTKIQNECIKFTENDQNLNKTFYSSSVEDCEWSLIICPLKKGQFHMKARFDSLDIAPEDGVFFLPHHFYSSV